MESTDNAFVASMQKKKKQKRIRSLIILCVVVVLVAAGLIFLFNKLNQPDRSASVLTYQATAVSEGEIYSTISGSGTLSSVAGNDYTAPASATVTAVSKTPGEAVAAGETILTLQSDAVDEELADLYADLKTAQTQLVGTTKLLANRNITAMKAGVVKDIRAGVGSAVEDLSYLCVISTDGKMKVSFDAPDGLLPYDTVSVAVGTDTLEGSVTEIKNGTATVVIGSNTYDLGAEAVVMDVNGAVLGTGALEVNDHVSITATAGRIASVAVSENQSVSRGTTLFKLAEGAPTALYVTRKAAVDSLQKQIDDLEDAVNVKAAYDCVLVSLSVEAGDEVESGASLCSVSASDGYALSLSIDELDIASVAIGQDVTVTLDAIEGEYAGKVTNISYAGSGSYVTTYTATIRTDPIPGAYPGMSASAEIITETSGTSMIVSVSAVQYDGDTAYVLLAPDGVSAGESAAETDLDLASVEKVTVETGMSDGSYIVINSDALQAGDVIYVANRTTTAVYTANDESTTTAFSFGSGMGGQMPAGGMGGEMPSGGMNGERPSGSWGGNRGSNRSGD